MQPPLLPRKARDENVTSVRADTTSKQCKSKACLRSQCGSWCSHAFQPLGPELTAAVQDHFFDALAVRQVGTKSHCERRFASLARSPQSIFEFTPEKLLLAISGESV